MNVYAIIRYVALGLFGFYVVRAVLALTYQDAVEAEDLLIRGAVYLVLSLLSLLCERRHY